MVYSSSGCRSGSWQDGDEWISSMLPICVAALAVKVTAVMAGMSVHPLRCQALSWQLCWWLAAMGCMDDPNCTAILCSGCHALLCLPWWGLADHGWMDLLCVVIPSGGCHAGAGRTGMTEESASLQWSVLPPGCLSASWKDQNIDMYTIKSSLRNKRDF